MATKHRPGCDQKHAPETPCNRDGPVIGGELARAREVEARHREQHPGTSPMEGIRYDGAKGEFDLFRFVESPVDKLVADFLNAHPSERRGAVGPALTTNDLYTLITFAERCALKALRTGETKYLDVGLEALTFIDTDRIDWRDASIAASMLSWAAQRLQYGPDAVAYAARRSESGMREMLDAFAASPITDLARASGYTEVHGHDGIAFVSSSAKPYAPSIDLTEAALDAVGVLEADRWRVWNLEVARELPAVWLTKGDKVRTESALGAVRAGVSVSGRLVGEDPGEIDSQHLLLFLVEAESEADAAYLADAAGPDDKDKFVGFGCSHGTLCAVLVSRSFVSGGDNVETQDSIERFRPGIEAVLKRYGK